jgi:hypothetical protein
MRKTAHIIYVDVKTGRNCKIPCPIFRVSGDEDDYRLELGLETAETIFKTTLESVR